MYSFDSIIEGVKYSVFIFSTFTGHSHPFTPYSPIDINEAYSRKNQTFYLAWYLEAEKNPKLTRLEKYWLRFLDYPAPEDRHSVPGRYYFSIKSSSNGFKIDKEIDAVSTMKLDLFYTYFIDSNGKVTETNIIKKGLIDKYSYNYKLNGIYENVKIEVFKMPAPFD